MAEVPAAAAYVFPAQKGFVLRANGQAGSGDIPVHSLHFSCRSDAYIPGNDYAGVILYAKERPGGDVVTDWREHPSNIHCKAGYIIVVKSKNLTEQFPKETGVIHGAAFRKVFGASASGIIGSGFSIQNRRVVCRSGAFNDASDRYHYYSQKDMGELESDCVLKATYDWMKTGNQTYDVDALKNMPMPQPPPEPSTSSWCTLM